MNQITIKDIASKLGISPSTVSRALNDHPDINKQTKKKIQILAAELGYEPNVIARNLKTSRSNQLGIVVPEIKHDFFAKIVSGFEDVAYDRGYTVIVAQSNEDENREKINLNSLYLNRTAGMIVSLSQNTTDTSHLRSLMDKGVKIVQFDRVSRDLDTYKVIIDDYQASYNAINYLISKGYSRIVHLAGPQNLHNCYDRFHGYRKALEQKGILFNNNLVKIGGMHEGDGQAAIESILNTKIEFDAIFAVNDPVAIGALRVLKSYNYKIPEDIALVGFSNNPITEYVSPSITTVNQPAYEMGKVSAHILISLIEEEELEYNSKIITLPTEFIIRESA